MYIAMGMSYEQFWDGHPHLAVAYRKAHKLKQELANQQAWLQGLYVYDALAVCLKNAFSKQGARKAEYVEQPIDIFPLTEAEKKRREAKEYEKMQEAMKAMQRQQRRKKQKGD